MKEQEHRYHHGDLRRALLDAALLLATQRGIHGFTLREVARQAGVSHNAPYHHFADKASLVAALAIENFAALENTLRQTYDQAEGNTLDKTLALGVAYVRFALEHTAAFHFMFRPELHQPAHNNEGQQIARAGDAAFQVLLDGVSAAQNDGLLVADEVSVLALTAWSTVHGLALLLVDSPVGESHYTSGEWPQSPAEAEQLTTYVMHILARGLVKR